ncbi:MAG: hypothetical protein A3C42_06240, partial [Chlamydiae bacterium RIFCSPHIGHO2_02_FULL_45_9]
MLGRLSDELANASSAPEKAAILHAYSSLDVFFSSHPDIQALAAKLNEKQTAVLLQLIVIGQAERIFDGFNAHEKEFFVLLDQLEVVDRFYREIGGIVGYQAKILELLQKSEEGECQELKFHAPHFLNISEDSADVRQAIEWGVDSVEEMAEIYPLGGAADRLHLVEEATGVELPAARLPFLGKTLLELLIRDLEAREYLFYQKTGRQMVTPIAIMTSQEKRNHTHVMEICEENHFFGRPADSFRFFTQPLVPAVDESGNWCLKGPLAPLLKPGGHGAIWKLAKDEGVFDWLKGLGRKKALIRQINNPIAGLDYGLLAFTGIGCKKNMVFGFASCPRLLKAVEGVNVLVERNAKLVLTNIEYCDFAKYGIQDKPLNPEEPYSRFSSNTNILFADLEAVSAAVEECPFPGLLVNLKKSSLQGEGGKKQEVKMARLESTMQNIADVFVEEKGKELKTERTFVTYNVRHKTISTAKKAYVSGRALRETPEHCFYDLLKANRELLERCQVALPKERTVGEYLEQGPELLFLYHPALGPLYSIIQRKIQGGHFHLGASVLFELADLYAKNLEVNGCLEIYAEKPIGHYSSKGDLHFSKEAGSCILENVTIENTGVDWKSSSPYWK